ncbi:hypothetical protein HYH02_008329 [Chlamydomonas schloesseri]|uniref:Ribosomal RNA-processing protein 14/surfeit locus protein 6 C-terminal domain-containing protein n=1 Tax=Chlamydomonas schloesseri TaxID=2026947 RepID=A0A836B472_9CHLO|nr:hypothetical protein HYH02_008329 [Chlamydomonas schloesseri]|eukprot:KAG2446769.1 hypothetical protein HYH02_008329 [Chlamydomonas schloesseri]
MAVDVAEQAKFFDHLVELVPAKYYYDDEFAKVNPRFLAKAARDALKAEAKTKAKEAKRERLDPDKAATTLELQRRKSQGANQKPAADGGADDAAPSTSGRKPAGAAAAAESGAAAGAAAASGLQLQLSGGSMSRQELLERLHKKVEEARQKRKASAEAATQAKEWRQNALKNNAAAKAKQQGGKRKAGDDDDDGDGDDEPKQQQRHNNKQQQGGKGQQQQKQQQQQPAAKKAKREAADGAARGDNEDFKFARIELPEGGRKGPAGAKKPPKAVLLKKAEQQRAELEALAGTEEGKAKAQQAAFKAALARAAGEKVLDDPKLLRRTLKREAKKREKSGKAWQERRDAQAEAAQARQAKRSDNLAARRQTKLDNKKAKREKKLLRPGFEGRKEGFVNAAPAAAK